MDLRCYCSGYSFNIIFLSIILVQFIIRSISLFTISVEYVHGKMYFARSHGHVILILRKISSGKRDWDVNIDILLI